MRQTTENRHELIEIARQKIESAKRPVSFSGAGLSAESGIATFRDKGENALWSKFNPTELASQEGFRSNPGLVIDWYNWRRRQVASAKPNTAHCALGSQIGWVHITQNVDQLLEEGGAGSGSVLHLHGRLYEDHCNANCGITESVDISAAPALRECPECGAFMRPSVVWFGETLPEQVFAAAISATRKTDLLLVVGTSASVVPAADLIDLARENGADIIVVNTETSDKLSEQDIELVGKAGTLLPKLFEVK